MAWCPVTKEQCTDECAWFKKSRRRYPDGHHYGECSIVKMSYIPDILKEINGSITTLEYTVRNKDFSE